MKTLAASAIMLVTLCAPAVAEPAPAAPEALKIRLAIRDVETTTHDLSVGPSNPCATAFEKHTDREIHVRACVTGAARLDVEWSTRSAWGEYQSTSSMAVARGATAEVGSAKGPRLTVTVQ